MQYEDTLLLENDSRHDGGDFLWTSLVIASLLDDDVDDTWLSPLDCKLSSTESIQEGYQKMEY